MASGSDRYAPVSLPNEFWVLAPDGELLPMAEPSKSLILDATKNPRASAHFATNASFGIAARKAKLKSAIHALARPDRQAIELVWDTVFWRRCLHFLTITLTAALVAYPWLDGIFATAVKSLIGFIPVIGADLPALERFSHPV